MAVIAGLVVSTFGLVEGKDAWLAILAGLAGYVASFTAWRTYHLVSRRNNGLWIALVAGISTLDLKPSHPIRSCAIAIIVWTAGALAVALWVRLWEWRLRAEPSEST